jgi:hypothetical protein
MAKSSSYRLSGRLNASRRSRLAYLTYLNSGGDPGRKREDEPTAPAIVMMLGGSMTANMSDPTYVDPDELDPVGTLNPDWVDDNTQIFVYGDYINEVIEVAVGSSYSETGAPLVQPNGYISLNHDDLDFFTVNGGGGVHTPGVNWTLEFWFRTTDTADDPNKCWVSRPTSFNDTSWYARGGPNGIEFMMGDGKESGLMDMGAVNDGLSHHLAVCKQAETVYFYIDGVNVGSTLAIPRDIYPGDTQAMSVGSPAGKEFLSKLVFMVDMFRVSNTNRYPDGDNFTPPPRYIQE